MKGFRVLNFNSLKELNSKLFFYLIFILAVLNILLLQLPITRYFHYEFASVNSILIILISSIFFTNQLKKRKIIGINNFLFPSLVFVLLPFFISLFFQIIRVECSFIDGLPFYLLITVPSVFFGITFPIIANSLSKKYSYFILPVLLLLPVITALVEIYFYPQIFSFNLYTVYFPGTVYDELIQIEFKWLLYRILNVSFCVLIIWMFTKNYLNKTKLILVLIIILLFQFAKPRIGFASDKELINSELGGEVHTKNFIIYYPKEIDKYKLQFISRLHEYYFSELSEYFNLQPQEKFYSFIFRNREEKKRLFGSANADVAKPWLMQMFLTEDSFSDNLKHELSHLFSAYIGKGLLKLPENLNMSLIEGLAVSADGSWGIYDIHSVAASIIKKDLNINLEKLIQGWNLFKINSSAAYVISGSIINYYIETFGLEKFKKAYAKGCLFDTEKDEKNFLNNYKLFIETKDEALSLAAIDYYFTGKPFIKKVCPRTVAWEEYRIKQKIYEKEYNQALEMINKLQQSYQSFTLIFSELYCYEKMNDYSIAISKIDKYLLDESNKPIFPFLYFRKGIYYGFSGDKDSCSGNLMDAFNYNINNRINEYCCMYSRMLDRIDEWANIFNYTDEDSVINNIKLIDENPLYAIWMFNNLTDLINRTKIVNYLFSNKIDLKDFNAESLLTFMEVGLINNDIHIANYFWQFADKKLDYSIYTNKKNSIRKMIEYFNSKFYGN